MIIKRILVVSGSALVLGLCAQLSYSSVYEAEVTADDPQCLHRGAQQQP